MRAFAAHVTAAAAAAASGQEIVRTHTYRVPLWQRIPGTPFVVLGVLAIVYGRWLMANADLAWDVHARAEGRRGRVPKRDAAWNRQHRSQCVGTMVLGVVILAAGAFLAWQHGS